MKYLIAGLGNIGAEYDYTRHNIGFMVADAFAKASATSFSADRLASVAYARHKGRQFVLIKPSTYMNLSGKAINYWLQKEKIPLENLLVVMNFLIFQRIVITFSLKNISMLQYLAYNRLL